jgi:hypothetical protein
MIWASGQPEEGFRRIWHCLGCGRETLADSEEQARDDRLREQLELVGQPHRDRFL